MYFHEISSALSSGEQERMSNNAEYPLEKFRLMMDINNMGKSEVSSK